jgi:hypothetical protein
MYIHKFEVDNLIAEQEWKIKQQKVDYHLYFITCRNDNYSPCHD